MKLEAGATLISNGTLVTGTGALPVKEGCVLVEEGRIRYAVSLQNAPALSPAVRKFDARGGTIMPSLVEAHFHATYFNIRALEDLDIKYPVEYVSLLASVNCRLAVECGYTAAGQWLDGFNFEALWSLVKCPVLLLQGDPTAGGAFTNADAAFARRNLANHQHLYFEGVGHQIHRTRPAEVIAALQRFVD